MQHAVRTSCEVHTLSPSVVQEISKVQSSRNGIYVFAYGSLLHKPGFQYTAKFEGYIKGWRRVWWQGSTDHRGTPAAPGRTVTLTRDEHAITWGAAYLLAGDDEQQAETLKYLEWREKQYDMREWCPVYGRDQRSEPLVGRALVYIGTSSPANLNYLGPAPLEHLARQIAHAAGPSGANYEYLYGLADAMRQMLVNDEEVFALEALVRGLREEDASTTLVTQEETSPEP